jgi:hypothetical protein
MADTGGLTLQLHRELPAVRPRLGRFVVFSNLGRHFLGNWGKVVG